MICCGDVCVLGASEAIGGFAVGDDADELYVGESGGVAGVDESLEVGAGAGDEDCDAHGSEV